MSKQNPTPNDQRAQVKDPSTEAHKADVINRNEQEHPGVPPLAPKVPSNGSGSENKKP